MALLAIQPWAQVDALLASLIEAWRTLLAVAHGFDHWDLIEQLDPCRGMGRQGVPGGRVGRTDRIAERDG